MFRIALVAALASTTSAVRQILEKNNDHYSSGARTDAGAKQFAFCRLKGTRAVTDSRRELAGKVYRASGWAMLRAEGTAPNTQSDSESFIILHGLPRVKTTALTVSAKVGTYRLNPGTCAANAAAIGGVTPGGTAATIALTPALKDKT